MVRYLENILPKHPTTYFRLAFSVDGIQKDHDINRSMDGSFKKIVNCYNAISPMRKRFKNLILDTNTVLLAILQGKWLKF